MTSPERPETLVDAVIQLSDNTVMLTERLTLSDQQHRRTRLLTWAVAGVMVLIAAVGYNSIEGNRDTAVRSCENANETRAANLSLWTTVLGSIEASESREENPWVDDLLNWIALLYQPHDCTDLDKVYKVPPPPTFETS